MGSPGWESQTTKTFLSDQIFDNGSSSFLHFHLEFGSNIWLVEKHQHIINYAFYNFIYNFLVAGLLTILTTVQQHEGRKNMAGNPYEN